MISKTVLALAMMGALSVATSGAIAQSDEDKKDEKKPEYSQLMLVQSDEEKKDEKKPELVTQSDEDKKDEKKPELNA